MKLAALCCTYRRPHTLGHLIACFLRQDYPAKQRELIILDDAGQYDSQVGDGWQLVSVDRRFHTLGEKRNACAALASADVEGFLVADDDDIYLPHWFSASADALSKAEWSCPGLVLLEHGKVLKEHETGGLYHGGWAFRKQAFYRVRGYGPHNNGEDQELAARLQQAATTTCDPCISQPPFYVYRNDNASYHLSWMDERGYDRLAIAQPKEKLSISITLPRDYATLPITKHFTLAPHVSPRDSKMPVELIGPVDAPGANGPTNGMYALQKELRQRIAAGLDWLTIKPLPVSEGALPWFWNWSDRKYAAWWDSEGRPFVAGPNMLFINSATPRIDHEECALLDAENCRGMICHSQWYRDLIAQHRGPKNDAPIFMWPYPIDPWPEGPAEVKYDLLIYAKNGHRPGLLEHLADTYPRSIQIHYGSYRRNELYQAACHSRACVYLADDDHGPLALQEILLAGCPTVGVRTGASLVRDGVTGVWVERLPSGPEHFESGNDEANLNTYLNAVKQAAEIDREEVRQVASAEFGTSLIVDRLLALITELRGV